VDDREARDLAPVATQRAKENTSTARRPYASLVGVVDDLDARVSRVDV
jgi:hypothetical protein